jgi:hypothetical protein
MSERTNLERALVLHEDFAVLLELRDATSKLCKAGLGRFGVAAPLGDDELVVTLQARIAILQKGDFALGARQVRLFDDDTASVSGKRRVWAMRSAEQHIPWLV